MVALPTTGTVGFSAISDNTYTDKPLFCSKTADGSAFALDNDKRAAHTQRLTGMDADGNEITTGYRLYLAVATALQLTLNKPAYLVSALMQMGLLIREFKNSATIKSDKHRLKTIDITFAFPNLSEQEYKVNIKPG